MSTGTLLQPTAPRPQPGASTNGTEARTHDDTRSLPSYRSGPLIYARPQDLPSFPSAGLKSNGAAASAAATLGWSRQKPVELWKPSLSASASAAALLANDHKMAAAWAPSPSSHGAQAAMLAHKNVRTTESWKPTSTTAGHSAANQAFSADKSLIPKPSASTINRQGSLMAAKGAMATRRRASTVPGGGQTYPDEANAAANALRAATRAHKPNRTSAPLGDAGAVPYTTMNRQMYTSHPPVKPEVDEQKREDVLHASAVAMAKQMFNTQQKLIEQTKKAHASDPTRPRRARSSSSLSDEARPMQFNTLQDAAYKLAQERLAKLHEENMQNRDYQEYYGNAKPQHKFSIRGKLRRRSSSDGDVFDDRQRSQQIRNQMSIFSTKLSQVDAKKRQQDRDALLAAAQKNVQARLKGMDEKIAAETGMVPASSLNQWEVKAQAAAQSRSDNRLSKHGKIDIGAGKYMDQDEIDAIAAQRVQPVLDEINEKAENERARQTELRLDAEAKREEREMERSREKEVAEISKKLKEQDKQELKEKKAEEKREAKAKREEEKNAKRLAKAEKHRSEPAKLPPQDGDVHRDEPVDAPERVALNDIGQPVKIPASAAPEPAEESSRATRVEIPDEQPRPKSDASSPSDKASTGKVKTWFRSHFSRGSKSDDDKPKNKKNRGFIGGAALTGMESNNASTFSVDNRSASVRAVAMAGKQPTDVSEDHSATHSPDADDVSTMNSSSDDEYFRDEVRDQLGTALTPPRPIEDLNGKKSHSPVRDSRFHELI